VRRRIFLVLAAASVTGLLTSFLVYRAVSRMAPRGQETENVVVAAVNLEVGDSVTSKHVKLSLWPKADVPGGAFRSLPEVEGWVARISIVTGEPLLKAKLLDPELAGRGGLLSMLVPEGLRGVTIKVNRAVQESGFIHPNSHVDVVVSITKGGTSGERIAKVVLQNVLVLAAGQTVEMRENKPVRVTTVTLALTPEQVERLALAQTVGRLMLATRNLRDDQVIRTEGATARSLLGHEHSTAPTKSRVSDAAPLPPPKLKTHAVSVLRGGRETDYKFVRGKNEPWSLVEPRR
jgi:pilus assembly protein CpaB